MQHKELEVSDMNLAITADFLGPNLPDILRSKKTHRSLERLRDKEFTTQVIHILCRFCREKSGYPMITS
ncbi:hypothetical protein M433DRAFT_545842 [Acidomyces richmondensis BFW]|nr:MAG: hypothetical protein FE78DRAFT_539936 [Acidomyces sp. 'richmondensis']KYG42292.1 hypothetical protein M433DRAFT_545842 [Acidomyces richmondensis BFW]